MSLVIEFLFQKWSKYKVKVSILLIANAIDLRLVGVDAVQTFIIVEFELERVLGFDDTLLKMLGSFATLSTVEILTLIVLLHVSANVEASEAVVSRHLREKVQLWTGSSFLPAGKKVDFFFKTFWEKMDMSIRRAKIKLTGFHSFQAHCMYNRP